jgi:hypothetical protein
VFNGLRWEVVVCFVDLFCWSWLNITLLCTRYLKGAINTINLNQTIFFSCFLRSDCVSCTLQHWYFVLSLF